MEDLSEFDKLNQAFSENEQRENAHPIYLARLLQKMMEVGNLNQTKLAEKKGKSNAWVSDYLSFLQFPDEALQIFTRVKITAWALRAIKRLPTPALQIHVARELQEGVLKPEAVERRVHALLDKIRKDPSKAPHTIPGGYEAKLANFRACPEIPIVDPHLPAPPPGWKPLKEITGVSSHPMEPDPLEDFWRKVGFDPQISIIGIPKVFYKGGRVWEFEVPATGVPPENTDHEEYVKQLRLSLRRWFQNMVKVLGDYS